MKSSDHFFVRKTQCTDHFHFLFELLTKKELKLLLSCIIKLESSQKNQVYKLVLQSVENVPFVWIVGSSAI